MSVRYRNGQGLFIDYPSEAIIDEETGERYYDGIKPNYVSSKEVCKLLNNLTNDNEQLKQQVAFLEEFIKTGVQYEYYQKIYEDNEQLKSTIDVMIKIFQDSGLDYVVSEEVEEILNE